MHYKRALFTCDAGSSVLVFTYCNGGEFRTNQRVFTCRAESESTYGLIAFIVLTLPKPSGPTSDFMVGLIISVDLIISANSLHYFTNAKKKNPTNVSLFP